MLSALNAKMTSDAYNKEELSSIRTYMNAVCTTAIQKGAEAGKYECGVVLVRDKKESADNFITVLTEMEETLEKLGYLVTVNTEYFVCDRKAYLVIKWE